jgi:hypothetical protein
MDGQGFVKSSNRLEKGTSGRTRWTDILAGFSICL